MEPTSTTQKRFNKLTKDEKESLKIFIRRFIRILLIIVAIKLIRLFIRAQTHDSANRDVVNSIKDELLGVNGPHYMQLLITPLVITGIIVLLGMFCFKGIQVLSNRIFMWIAALTFIDALLVFIFPELYIATINALFFADI